MNKHTRFYEIPGRNNLIQYRIIVKTIAQARVQRFAKNCGYPVNKYPHDDIK